MTIGPDARRMASGRVTVVAGLEAAIGILAVVMGTGPLVTTAGAAERGVGLVGIVLGVVLIAGGSSVLIKRGPSRALGMAGGGAMMALGALVAVLAGASTGECAAVDDAAASCYGLILAISAIGVAVAVTGLASVAVIRRAHPAAFTRRRGRATPPRP